MIRICLVLSLTTYLSVSTVPQVLAADPWADNVVDYIPGSDITNDFVDGDPFDDANVALGEPTRFTSDAANFGGAITPLQSAFRNDEVVSIGKGGTLTVSFDEPVTNDSNNPFGIDLLIFGNSFLFGSNIFNADFSFNSDGTIDGVEAEGGIVEISDDGLSFELAQNVSADGLFPTYAFSDIVDPFPTVEGSTPTNFTKPVNPALEIVGKTFAEIITAYDGSGGGAGIDIGAIGFDQITHVRISNPADALTVPEIDAFADVTPVPEPATLIFAGMMGIAALLGARRRQLARIYESRTDTRPEGWFNV